MFVVGIVGYILTVMAIVVTWMAVHAEDKTSSKFTALVAWNIYQGVCVYPNFKAECQIHDCRNCWIVHSEVWSHKVDELIAGFEESGTGVVTSWEQR